jgi:tripartite-type tricarboxylate transporter receptor subunit TctC
MRRIIIPVALATVFASTGTTWAAYPEKPVTIVVNFSAGGPLDALARMIAEQAAAELKQPFIVDNKPGAGGNIGAAAVAKAAPDGYTLLFTLDSLLTINPYLYPSLGFDPKKAFTPVALVGTFAQTLVVNPQLQAKTLPELLALAKTKDITYASAGNGTPGHLTFEHLLQKSGVRMTHVPYKGAAPAVADLLGGQVDAGFLVTSGVLPHVQTGKLRAIAVSGNERIPQLPNVPTVAESGVSGFDVRFAFILLAPAGTPAPIIKTLHEQVSKALGRSEVLKRLQTMDIQPASGGSSDVNALIGKEAARWSAVIKTAGVRLE